MNDLGDYFRSQGERALAQSVFLIGLKGHTPPWGLADSQNNMDPIRTVGMRAALLFRTGRMILRLSVHS